jgi:preprotein translocase subunit SecG
MTEMGTCVDSRASIWEMTHSQICAFSSGVNSISGAAETYWGRNKGRSMEGMLVKITKILAVFFMLLAVVLNLNVF